jgi:hypothetical protein
MPMIDLYCERTAAGLWNEPANVLSNAAFLLAAWAIWRLQAESPLARARARRFGVLVLAIAVGSALFHMLATPWARLLDEGPIVVFQLAFLWSYGRGVRRWPVAVVVSIMAGLVLTSVWLRSLGAVLNWSLPYAPAVVLTTVLGVLHARDPSCRRGRWSLAVGASVFVVAVVLRSIDGVVCSAFPLGTHFLWHFLTAIVVYLYVRGLVWTHLHFPPLLND